ncbi:MAG: bifunctional ornithine acetyltransferase/N-acetylglutamate synthase, partial [Epsilonproteobacteria bacterium 4484_20]
MSNYTITPLKNGLENVQGFYCDAVNAGLRPDKEQGDVAFIRSEVPCDISAVFTRNTFQAAPIKHFQKYPQGFQTDFVLINAKNANAMTGPKGIEDIDTIMSTLQTKL